jgi:acid stress-induced BolA-like protein IbaG/YrbA
MYLIIGAGAIGPCNIAPMNPEEVAQLIRAGLPGAQVQVQSDDRTHFTARVVAREFAQLRSLARHQLVYRALGERMGREIHALSIEALTPEESQQG